MERDKLIQPRIIGVLLQGGRMFVEHAHLTADLQVTDFEDPQLRTAYDWILKTYNQGLEPTPEIVHTVSGKKLPLEWLQNLAKVEDYVLDDELIAMAKVVVKASDVREMMKTLVGALQAVQAVQQADTDDEIDTVKGKLVDKLIQSRSTTMLDSSAKGIYERHLAHRGHLYVSPTYLPWLDGWLKGGLRSKRFLSVAGRQGGRKSTWARNIVLGAARDKQKRARQDVSIAWMAFENDQQISLYDFAVMCAMEWLRENKHYEARDNGMLIRNFLDAETVSFDIDDDKIKTWPKLAQQAIAVGIERASALPLWIYDSGEATGALTSRTALWRCVAAHAWNHAKDKHLIVVIDYAQLIREDKASLYQDMQALSHDCLSQVNRLNCTIVLLSQFNEDFNKDTAKGETMKGYTGIKGGGDILASVQNMMIVEYDTATADVLNVHSGKARRGKATGGMNYLIEPITGIVIGTKGEVE